MNGQPGDHPAEYLEFHISEDDRSMILDSYDAEKRRNKGDEDET